MHTLRIFYEYQCLPIWENSESGELLGDRIPPELLKESELTRIITDLAQEYDSLFIDNERVFEFKGFSSDSERTVFLEKTDRAIEMIKVAARDKYIVLDEVDRVNI